MSRSTFTFRHGLSAEKSAEVAAKYLEEKGMKRMTLKTGEPVWKNGTGIIISAQFLSLYYENKKTTVYAWIQAGAGLTSRSETDLYGVGNMLPKRMITKILNGLEETLRTADPDYQEAEYAAWPEDEVPEEPIDEEELIEDDELMDGDEYDEDDDEDEDDPDGE